MYNQCVADFSCECSVCKKQARGKAELPKIKSLKTTHRNIGTRKRFIWLLAELGIQSLTHEVAIPTPEVVVFGKCRPQFLIQSSNHLLKYSTSGDKLRLTEILKSYTKIVRNRKKEEKPGVKSSEPYGKEIALLRYTLNNKDNDSIDETPEYENGPLRVLSEKEFFDFMYERAGSNLWKNIVYIQTVIKCKTGIGDVISINYSTAKPMNLDDLKSALVYDADEKIMSNDNISYCQLICKRIDALMHFYSRLEILHMKAEFCQDDLGKIWFMYATDICVRQVNMPKQLTNEQGKLTEEELAALNADLDERITQCSGKPKFEEYSNKMIGIYHNVKEKADVDRVLTAKPVCYVDNNLIQELQTRHTWIKNNPIIRKSAFKMNRDKSSFDPRNTSRTKQRFELIKNYSKNEDFFPTNYTQRREWIYTPTPEPNLRNKSSFILR
ncbi:hypothetical protein SteCoe_4740 [Stentor coeruleus]|uniref:Uncharacterized protein n=1 Tax=Stentor coeruleus TaxID=5963 RepID=A0A1R2CU56_9CILI|nr:hypothetical protein SteCoe_4740 [Stentor coeruleus]